MSSAPRGDHSSRPRPVTTKCGSSLCGRNSRQSSVTSVSCGKSSSEYPSSKAIRSAPASPTSARTTAKARVSCSNSVATRRSRRRRSVAARETRSARQFHRRDVASEVLRCRGSGSRPRRGLVIVGDRQAIELLAQPRDELLRRFLARAIPRFSASEPLRRADASPPRERATKSPLR